MCGLVTVKSRVVLPAAIRAEMACEADRKYPDETGGVLLGYEDAEDSGFLEICAATGPGPRASHMPNCFVPDSAWQDSILAQEYERSGRVVTYLGDWHSHPDGSSIPSRLDRATARRIARCAEARAPAPLMLILGGAPEAWTVAIYRYSWRWLWKATPIFKTS